MNPTILVEWVGTGFVHGCIIYGAVFGATILFDLIRG